MCTLAVYRGTSGDFPLIVAANRDELYARPARPPARLASAPQIVAGLDLQAGGTWLGCTVGGAGLVAGVLNRRVVGEDAPIVAGELSRGRLCLDALRRGSVDAALDVFDAHSLTRYGPFNLLLADDSRAVVVNNSDGVGVTELADGLSVLTNLDVNDPRCPRLANATTGFVEIERTVRTAGLKQSVRALASVLGNHDNTLATHDPSPLARVCVHTPEYGTRSSSIIAIGTCGDVRYFHADGPPCVTPYEEVTL